VSKKAKKADEMWKALPWKKFERHRFRLQRAIFKAQKNGEKTKVKRDALTATTQSGSPSFNRTSGNPAKQGKEDRRSRREDRPDHKGALGFVPETAPGVV